MTTTAPAKNRLVFRLEGSASDYYPGDARCYGVHVKTGRFADLLGYVEGDGETGCDFRTLDGGTHGGGTHGHGTSRYAAVTAAFDTDGGAQ